MNHVEFLQGLVLDGWQLWAEDGTLRYRAPKTESVSDILQQLKTQKADILTLLRDHPHLLNISPLSYNQRSLWFLWQLDPNSPAYNVAFSSRIVSSLNIPLLQAAFQQLVDQDDILRAVFPKRDQEPIQVIQPHQTLDFQAIEVPTRSDDMKADVFQVYQQPFDLEHGPLLRVRLWTCAGGDFILLLTVHHIVCDAWSLSLMLQRVSSFYRDSQTTVSSGSSDSSTTATISYTAYTRWQQQMLAQAEGDRLWTYWQEQLAGELPILQLPTDHPRPLIKRHQGTSVYFELSESLTTQLRQLAQTAHVTPYVLLLAVFQVFLHRYSGQSDIIVGSPMLGRTQPQFFSTVGNFANPVVIRVDVSDRPTFLELLQQTRQRVREALEHQDFPFALLVERLQPQRDSSISPIFQTSFTFHDRQKTEMMQQHLYHTLDNGSSDGLALATFELPQQEGQFDVDLEFTDHGVRLTGMFQANTDLFEPETIARFVELFQILLDAVVANPDGLITTFPFVTPKERQRLLQDWSTSSTNSAVDSTDSVTESDAGRPPHLPPDTIQTIDQWIEHWVKVAPDTVAVVDQTTRLSYQDLDDRANQLAHYLRDHGVQSNTLVGICVDRSVMMIMAVLGVMKAGAAYVPIDPNYPAERIEYIINDAQLSMLLTEQALQPRLSGHTAPVVCLDQAWTAIARYPATSFPSTPDLAYVIYTSGSTGAPKGVAVDHDSLLRTYRAWESAYQLTATTSHHLQLASMAFDVFTGDWVRALGSGKTLVICPAEWRVEPEKLYALMQAEFIDALETVPAVMRILVDYLQRTHQRLDFMRLLVVGSDQWTGQDFAEVQQLCGSSTRVINSYGVTEATIDSCYFIGDCSSSNVYPPSPPLAKGKSSGPSSFQGDIRGKHLVPIGRPLPDTYMYVLSPSLQLLPIGLPGELCIGGPRLAQGYYRQPKLNQTRFVENPFNDGRLYRTGDLARFRADGQIELWGRLDHQVKLRGMRIELGEIEARLEQHPEIHQALVTLWTDEQGTQRLVAHGVTSSLTLPSDWRLWLKATLPDYMIPAAFVPLETFPLTPNGKVNRQALPIPVLESDRKIYTPPQTSSEEILADIWQQVLGLSQVSRQDNFFAIGGDSILSIQVTVQAQQAGIHLTPAQFYQHPTLAELATVVTFARTTTVDQSPVTGPVPLIPVQAWFFEQDWSNLHHYNQSIVLQVPPQLNPDVLTQSLTLLATHHDGLRLRYHQVSNEQVSNEQVSTRHWQQINEGMDAASIPLTVLDCSKIPHQQIDTEINAIAHRLQSSLHLENGPLMQALLITGQQPTRQQPTDETNKSSEDLQSKNRLLLVAHHLCIDGVSWRILLADLWVAYDAIAQGTSPKLPPKTTSFQDWSNHLHRVATQPMVTEAIAYWQTLPWSKVKPLPVDQEQQSYRKSETTYSVTLAQTQTQALLHRVHQAYHTQINDVLLTALAQSYQQWTDHSILLLDLEGHGREAMGDDIDVSRTVGWFTSVFPVILQLEQGADSGKVLKSIKEQMRSLPQRGMGYGICRYLCPQLSSRNDLASWPTAEISFNYLGQFDANPFPDSSWQLLSTSLGNNHDPNNPSDYLIEITAWVIDDQLTITWSYSPTVHEATTIMAFAQGYLNALETLIHHCLSPTAGGYTPSDFPGARLTPEQLDQFLGSYLSSGLAHPRPQFSSCQGEEVPVSSLDKGRVRGKKSGVEQEAVEQRTLQNIEDIYDLSPMQQGLLFHSLYQPDEHIYDNAISFTLSGTLNIDAFQDAWQQLMDRYPVLRTSLHWQNLDQPLQVVHSHVELPWQFYDWRTDNGQTNNGQTNNGQTNNGQTNNGQTDDPDEATVKFNRLKQEQQKRGLELTQAPLMACILIRLTDDQYRFLWRSHHSILDGWSQAILIQQMILAYDTLKQGRTLPPSSPPPYRNYILWLQQQEQSNAQQFWQRALQGIVAPTPLMMPPAQSEQTRSSTPSTPTSHTLTLPLPLTQSLQAWVATQPFTLATVLLGAWGILLHRYCGESDIVFGVTISHRPPDIADIDQMVGLLINTLPLRLTVTDDDQARPWLDTVHRQQMDLQLYGHCPLFEIQAWSDVPNDVALFDSLVIIENYPIQDFQMGEIQITDVDIVEHTNYPLTLVVVPGDRLSLTLHYDSDRFSADSIQRMLGHLQTILDGIVADPDSPIITLPLLTQSERHQVLVTWNDTAAPYPSSCLHELFEAQVQRTPDAIAIQMTQPTKQITYHGLNTQANQLAQYLKTLGVGPDMLVGICVDRSIDMVIGLLGILKAGGAYVPLAPSYPQHRLQFMLQDAQMSILLTQASVIEQLPPQTAQLTQLICLDQQWPDIAHHSSANLNLSLTSENLAYMIYTSGSTGQPKGVEISHGSVSNFLQSMAQRPGLSPQDKLLSVTPLSFDIAALELFLPLFVGSQVVLVNRETALDGTQLKQKLATSEATVMQATPATWQMLLVAGWQGNPDLKILCGGEALSLSLARQLLQCGSSLWNMYGPTESTIWSTVSQITANEDLISIGCPIANTQVYLLDNYLNPVSVGLPGELYIGGDGLARGYFNRPDLTAQRFISNPFATDTDAKLYKTGDLVRWLSDGQIEYLGRIDHQVKLRGFRIELGEIEVVLSQHSSVQHCVVVATDHENGVNPTALIAYVVPTLHPSDESDLSRDLRRDLSRQLPRYMIPNHIVFLETIPLTPSGKVDRQALTRLPPPTVRTVVKPTVEPIIERTHLLTTEQRIRSVFADVLSLPVESIHRDHTFFDLGGHSLQAMQILSKLSVELGYSISLQTLFNHPTVTELTTVLDSQFSHSISQGITETPSPSLAPGSYRPALSSAKAIADPPTTDQSSFLQFEQRSLLSLFAMGKLPPVDAVALTYIPLSILTQIQSHGPFSRHDILQSLSSHLPWWMSTVQTQWGRIGGIVLPQFEDELYADSERLLDHILNALHLAKHIGARTVSLTGLIPSATDYGHDIIKAMGDRRQDFPSISTGHGTTCASVVLAIRTILHTAQRQLSTERVALLGVGSVGLSTLKLMLRQLPHPQSLLLCDLHQKESELESIRNEIIRDFGFQGEVAIALSYTELPSALYKSTLIIGATNVANVLDIHRLRTGTLLVDDSGPHCFDVQQAIQRIESQHDILITEGGVLQSPYLMPHLINLPNMFNEETQQPFIHQELTVLNPFQITGCVFSSVLSSHFDSIQPTLGMVDTDCCTQHYSVLKQLEFDSPPLHFEHYIIPESVIRKFYLLGDQL